MIFTCRRRSVGDFLHPWDSYPNHQIFRLHSIQILGIEDAFYACCCLIEWPDKLEERLPADQIRIDLAMGSDTGARVVALAAAAEILDQFKQDYFS